LPGIDLGDDVIDPRRVQGQITLTQDLAALNRDQVADHHIGGAWK
jgi:hypothetical protein